MSAFRLRDDVGFCRIGPDHVFLDLANDRYFCLDPRMNEVFALLVDGEVITNGAADALQRIGAIVPCSSGRPRACTALPASETHPVDDRAAVSAIIRALLGRELWARRIRQRPLLANLRAITAKRDTRVSEAPDPSRARTVAAAYEAARLIKSETGQCLPRSLALMSDLIRLGLSPSLIFAVQLGPFQAHCWVELSGMLVAESHERVSGFTPLMVV